MLALLDKLQGVAQWGVGLESDIAPDGGNVVVNPPPVVH